MRIKKARQIGRLFSPKRIEEVTRKGLHFIYKIAQCKCAI